MSGLDSRPEDFNHARAELDQVIQQYEAGDSDIAKNAGLAYGYLGLLARQRGDLPSAVIYYNRAVSLVAPMSRAL